MCLHYWSDHQVVLVVGVINPARRFQHQYRADDGGHSGNNQAFGCETPFVIAHGYLVSENQNWRTVT